MNGLYQPKILTPKTIEKIKNHVNVQKTVTQLICGVPLSIQDQNSYAVLFSGNGPVGSYIKEELFKRDVFGLKSYIGDEGVLEDPLLVDFNNMFFSPINAENNEDYAALNTKLENLKSRIYFGDVLFGSIKWNVCESWRETDHRLFPISKFTVGLEFNQTKDNCNYIIYKIIYSGLPLIITIYQTNYRLWENGIVSINAYHSGEQVWVPIPHIPVSVLAVLNTEVERYIATDVQINPDELSKLFELFTKITQGTLLEEDCVLNEHIHDYRDFPQLSSITGSGDDWYFKLQENRANSKKCLDINISISSDGRVITNAPEIVSKLLTKKMNVAKAWGTIAITEQNDGE